METTTKQCPYCAETVHLDAIKCKHCGELLDDALKAARSQQVYDNAATAEPQRKWNPGIAALLSFVIPGAGQMYKGHIGTGPFWFIITIVAYCLFILPGIVLHIICIVAAASGDPYK